jgi:hypothetical protein
MASNISAAAVASAVLVACAAAPPTSEAQPVPRKAHYVGETSPGAGFVEVTVNKRRVVDVRIDYRYWRCSGPGSDRQAMGWDLEVFSPGSPRLRVGRDGRVAYRHASGDRNTFSRFALTGRFSAHGRRVAGTFRWQERGITQRGPVECRSPLIRYTAWVSEREFAGTTSQGVPVRAALSWTYDPQRWMTGRPPYIQGVFRPVVGLKTPPPPFSELLLPCPSGDVQTQDIVATANPRTGQLSAPPIPLEPGEQFVVDGRASPLATTGPATVSLSITGTRMGGNDPNEFCTGSATFDQTELAPLVP